MLITLWGDFASRDNPFHDLRQGIARYAGVVDDLGESHADRDELLPMAGYTLRLARTDYARQHAVSADALRFDFGRFGEPTADLDAMLSTLTFDGGPHFIRTVADLDTVGQFVAGALAEVAAAWRRLAVKLDGLIVGAAEGTNDGGKRSYVVIVPKTHPSAGDNVTISGRGCRVGIATWKLLRKLADARETGKRLSLADLRTVAGQDAHKLIPDFNKLGDGYPLIDTPNREKGRGYALN